MELFVGQNIVKLSRVDSTNSYLKTLLSNCEPLAEGTVIMADEQFAGRGQRDALWKSQPGKNLTFSFCLFPAFLSPEQQFELNKVVSLGITDALTKISSLDYKIKWPNDIYLNNKKLGGILIENSIRSQKIRHSVIGIGLNVNQTDFGELSTATSLLLASHQELDLENLLKEICKGIEIRYRELKNGYGERLHKDYICALYRFDELTGFISKGKSFNGKITDVSSRGELMVKSEGQIKNFSLKTISFIQ